VPLNARMTSPRDDIALYPARMPWSAIALLLLSLGFALLVGWYVRGRRVRRARRWRLRAAQRVIDRLESGQWTAPQRLSYLRKVEPFVFEELVGLLLSRLGFRMLPSSRYTGDGGIDGRAHWLGRFWLIQVKRYGRHIDWCDVEQFAHTCAVQHAIGLFVHTGRTGAAAYAALSRHVILVSGERLLQLFETDPERQAATIAWMRQQAQRTVA
jgi:restriction system protein